MTDRKMLGKDDILGKVNLKTEDVDVPEWGGSVRVRELSAEERDSYENELLVVRQEGRKTTVTPNLRNAKAKIVVRAVIDEEGNRLFEDKDVDRLGKLSAQAIDRVAEVVSRLSGLTPKDVEELTGNS